MNNILFITRYYGEMLGGTMCSQRNIDSLKEIYDNVYEYRITDKNGFRFYISRIAQLCHGYMGGIDYKDIQSIKKIIQKYHCQTVFIDSSLLGKLAPILRHTFNKIKIHVFFTIANTNTLNRFIMDLNSIYMQTGLLRVKEMPVNMLIKS